MNQEIYQDIILSHFRDPQMKVSLSEETNNIHSIKNPNCGDLIKLKVVSKEGKIQLKHDAQGCAVSVASCSIMCEVLNGISSHAARGQVELFLKSLDSDLDIYEAGEDNIELASLMFFRNVPARKLCVSLAWSCLQNALATIE